MRWATLDKSLYPSFLPAQKGPNNAYLLGCEEQIYNGHLTPSFLEFAYGANVVSTDHDGEMSALKSMDTPWGLKRQCPGENCFQDLGVVIRAFPLTAPALFQWSGHTGGTVRASTVF